MQTVEGQKREVEESEQLLNQRRFVIPWEFGNFLSLFGFLVVLYMH